MIGLRAGILHHRAPIAKARLEKCWTGAGQFRALVTAVGQSGFKSCCCLFSYNETIQLCCLPKRSDDSRNCEKLLTEDCLVADDGILLKLCRPAVFVDQDRLLILSDCRSSSGSFMKTSTGWLTLLFLFINGILNSEGLFFAYDSKSRAFIFDVLLSGTV